MDIGNTKGEAADRGGGSVHCPQRRGGHKAAIKSIKVRMDFKVDMAAGGLEDSTTEVMESKHKERTKGAARF